MRTSKLLVFLGLVLLMSACTGSDHQAQQTNQTEEADLKTALQGTWQTYQINVAVNTVDGLDSFHAVNLNEEVWENGFGIKPPIHYFHANENYRMLRVGLNGETLDELTGDWTIKGDTLVINTGENSEKYMVKQGNGKSAFRTFLDWDGDGEADDEYQSLQRQISIGTE